MPKAQCGTTDRLAVPVYGHFFSFPCTLILYIDRVSISVVAPVLRKEFGRNEAIMGTVLSAFLSAICSLRSPAAW